MRPFHRSARVRPLLFALCSLFFPLAAFGEGAYLVKQINFTPQPTGSFPDQVTQAGAVTFLSADDRFHGTELWRTNGTQAGTTLVKDINPGFIFSVPSSIRSFGSSVVFNAFDPVTLNIYRSDGTAAGTTALTSFGLDSFANSDLAVVGSTVYFSAFTPADGAELWRSNGSPGGASLVTNINSGSASANPNHLTAVGTTLFFFANDGSGSQLWTFDGVTPTKVSTTVFTNVSQTLSANGLFFVIAEAGGDAQLWSSSGSTLTQLTSLTPGVGFSLAASGGSVFFAADDGSNGVELWKSNGTMGGTSIVQNINPTGDSSPTNMVDVGGTLYFIATDDGTNQRFFTSNGTSVTPVTAPGAVNTPDGVGAIGADLVFLDDPGSGVQVFKLSGSTITQLTFFAAPLFGFPIGTSPGKVYYAYDDGVHGFELLVTNGTPAGSLVLNIAPDLPSALPQTGFDEPFLSVGAGRVIFSAIDETHGEEPWLSDGTSAGTNILRDLDGSANGSSPEKYRLAGSNVFFIANDGPGREVWFTNLTSPGTILPKDVNPTDVLGSPARPGILGNRALFSADDGGGAGLELWISDGTNGGTILLKDINVPVLPQTFSDSRPIDFFTIGSQTFFTAFTLNEGVEPWVTDGSTANTHIVKDINLGVPNSQGTLSWKANIGGKLYFVADDGAMGKELWTSDGTEPNTARLTDIAPGAANSDVEEITALGSLAVFRATNGTAGSELWVYNTITTALTQIDICPGACDSRPFGFLAIGSTVYFRADDGVHGAELWKTDGTPGGTSMIADIATGVTCSCPFGLTDHNGIVYFSALNLTQGEEVWKSDGTAAGTVLVADVEPGSGASLPFAFASTGSRVFFWATTTAVGSQVFATGCDPATHYSISAPPTSVAGTTISITVTPLDAANAYDPCYNGIVHFTSNDPLATLPPDYTFLPGEGTHTFTVTFRTAGARTVTATDTLTAITGSATVTVSAGATVAAQSTLAVAPPSVTANGVAAATATVQARDAFGNNISTGGATVAINTSFGNISGVTDNGNGTYSAAITSTVAGNGTVSGMLNGSALANTAPVVFVPGPASGATSTITAMPTQIAANGVSTSTITVRLFDANGNALTIGGATVVLQTTLGTLGAVSDNNNGTYTATLTSGFVQGTAIISGTVNGSPIADTASVNFVSDIPALSTLSLMFVVASLAVAALFVLRRH